MVVGASISKHVLIAKHVLIDITLIDLPDEYESFIDLVMLRISSIALDELHGLLLNKEFFMNRKNNTVSFSTTKPFQAFATQYQQSQPPLLPTPQFNVIPQALAAQAPQWNYNKNYGKSFSQ